MLGFLAAAAGAVIGGVVGGGATIVSSLVHGHGFPSWGRLWRGVEKGAIVGGVGVGLVALAACVLGVAVPVLLASAGAGLVAATLYSLLFRHHLPSWQALAAGGLAGVLSGVVLALALGAVSFMGLGSVAGAIAVPTAVVGGSVAGGELAKVETNYEQLMQQEKKQPAPTPIVVPGDTTTSTTSSPSEATPPPSSKGLAGSLPGH